MSLQAYMPPPMCAETKQVGKEGLTLAAACVQTRTRISKNGPRVFGSKNEQVSTQSSERCTVPRPAVDAHLQRPNTTAARTQWQPEHVLSSRPQSTHCVQNGFYHATAGPRKRIKEYKSSAGGLCSADMVSSQTNDPIL